MNFAFGTLDPFKPHALEGITVVDFIRVLARPTCTRMLADAGARVIKIERPKRSGDDTRLMGPFTADGTSEDDRFANLGKESITLDLKALDELDLAKSMIARADVVVENFRPGLVKNVAGSDAPETPLKCGAYDSVGTRIPAPPLDNRGSALRAEFGQR